MSEVTRILSAIEHGQVHAAEQLLPLVYEELRKLAAHKLAQEQPGQTLDATALVHEAYIRLVDVEKTQHWYSRGHFFAAAAEAMRRILIENARHRKTLKRGGDRRRIDLAKAELTTESCPDQMLLLDDALAALTREDVAAAELAKLRLFAGLSVEQSGAVIGISRATAFRLWAYARAWLNIRLRGNDSNQNSP
jgi:RNA polymerase sigma factor (TIGR02999 family)